MIKRENMSMTKIFKTAFQPMQISSKQFHGQAFRSTWKMLEENSEEQITLQS